MEFKKKITEASLMVKGIAGILASVVAIYAYGGDFVDKVGEYVVSDNELKIATVKITKKFDTSVVKISNIIIEDLIAQKAKVSTLLLNSEKEGEIALYKIQIDSINDRIVKLRGK